MVSASIRCDFSYFDWIDSNGAFGKKNRESCGYFSSPMASNLTFSLLQTNFATGRTNQENVHAHLTDAFMNVDDWIQHSV